MAPCARPKRSSSPGPSTRARVTTAPPGCSTAGAWRRTHPGRTRTAWSTRRSRPSGSPARRPSGARSSTRSSCACSASCSWSAPSSPPRPGTEASCNRACRSSPRRWSTDLEPLIDDITARYDPPTEFVLPGENRAAAALDVARTVVRRAERRCVAAAHDGWLATGPGGSEVVAYLNRLADLVYTLARWQEGTFRPVRTRRRRRLTRHRSDVATTCRLTGGTVPLTFSVSTSPADRVAADLLAVPVGTTPAPSGARTGRARTRRAEARARSRCRRGRRRARRRARRVPRRGGLRRASSATRSRCRPAASCAPRP